MPPQVPYTTLDTRSAFDSINVCVAPVMPTRSLTDEGMCPLRLQNQSRWCHHRAAVGPVAR